MELHLGIRYRSSGKTAYQLADHLGNVRAVVMENEGNAIRLLSEQTKIPVACPYPIDKFGWRLPLCLPRTGERQRDQQRGL